MASQRAHLSRPDEKKGCGASHNPLIHMMFLAEWTGLEPATPGVTGRYSNQLNYHSWQAASPLARRQVLQTWRPYGDSNPGTHRERVMS